MRFLLLGLGAELSLRPLGRALERAGHDVLVCDLGERPLPRRDELPGDGPLVLVTSQHLHLAGAVVDDHYGIATHYVSPFAAREALAPELLVFVPHDLLEPVQADEIPFLRELDLYVAPDEDAWWAREHVRTEVCGWVGTAGPVPPLPPAEQLAAGVLFLSNIRWTLEQGGPGFLVEQLRRTLATGIAVKLPAWPGADALAAALTAAGTRVLDPLLPAAALCAHTPLVATWSPSSVLAEAALAGHRPVCIVPPGLPLEASTVLGNVDAVLCDDAGYTEAARAAGRVREATPAFDLDRFLGAVDDLLGHRG